MKLSVSSVAIVLATSSASALNRDWEDKSNLRGLQSLSSVGTNPCMVVTTDLTLAQDVTCDCSSNPTAVIEVRDVAKLDLNGKTVKCSKGTTTQGVIVASGTGNEIRNGIVVGSQGDTGDGIHLSGTGSHFVEAVIVTQIARHCIASENGTSNNRIVYASVESCGESGIWAEGTGDYVEGNYAFHTKKGMTLQADGITAQYNYVLRSSGEGIDVRGTDCKVLHNGIEESFLAGISVYYNGARAEVFGNQVSGCYWYGISVRGSDCVVSQNTVFRNNVGITTYDWQSLRNLIKNNIAYDNSLDYFDGSWDNTTNATCGNNIWCENQGTFQHSCPNPPPPLTSCPAP